MSQLTEHEEKRREVVENALAALGRTDLALRVIELRARQILDRTGLTRLVCPIFYEVNELRVAISTVRGILEAEWKSGEQRGWRKLP